MRALAYGMSSPHVASRSPLRPWDVAHASWTLPLVAAGIAASLASGARPLGVEAQRSVAFALGPALLLVTLHARTAAYLHDEGLATTLPLPVPPRRRFAIAWRSHLVGLLWQAVCGAVAFAIAGSDAPARMVLVADWLALVLTCALVEPAGAAASALLGRRVPEDSVAGQLQRAAGGGWTLPEAVVHLWAPAMALATAAAVAMPLQLTIDRWADGRAPGRAHLVACTLALSIAAVLRVAAVPAYCRGMFDAVPWLRQAMRTLAGPPVPSPAPRWLAAIRDPGLRLTILQHQRLTPVPTLRLVALLGTAVILTVRTAAPGIAELGILVGLVALWLVPADALRRHGQAQRRLLSPLPLTDHRARAWACLLAPVVLAALPVAWRVVASRVVGGEA